MAGKKGVPKSAEWREKIKANWTDERREAIRQRSLGNKFASREWTPEQRAARALFPSPNKGKQLSPEHRAKLSAARMGKSVRLLEYGISQERYTAEIEAGNRWCSHGKHFHPGDDFTGKKGVCKSCGPEHDRRSALRNKYGVTHEWYEIKLAEQGGGCAICGGGASNGDKHLAVDHNHSTGAARGVLCAKCNTFLERVETQPGWIEKALAYLAQYK